MKKPIIVSKCPKCDLHQGKVEKILKDKAIYVCPVCLMAWAVSVK